MLRQNWWRRPAVWWTSFAAVLLAVTAYNLLNTLENNGLLPDEQIVMMMTRELAAGRHVYVTFIDHYPPGVAIAGAPFVWLLGNTALAAKAAVVFYTILFTGAVGYLAGALTRTSFGAWLATGLAGFFGGWYAVVNGVNVSYYAAIFVALGAACAVNVTRERHAAAWVFVGGVLVGLGFMSKPSIVLEVPMLAALIYRLKRYWRPVAIFLGGTGLAILGVSAYFAVTGTFYEMFYVSFLMNFTYLGAALFGMQIQGYQGSRMTYVHSQLLKTDLPHYSGLLVLGLILAAWCWHRTPQQRVTLAILVVWALAAFIESVMPLSMGFRYFCHIIAPLAVLAALGAESVRSDRRALAILGSSVPLLAVGAYAAHIYFPARTYAPRERYDASIAFMNSVLGKDDCVLTWGWLSGLTYYAGREPCSRIATEGNMFPRGMYDIRQQRSWYLEDILNTRPTLLARQDLWSFFPQMARLIENRHPHTVFKDPLIQTRYVTLDWSSFRPAEGSIAGELELLGYDIQGATVQPGSDVSVTLYWKVRAVPRRTYQGFVHLTALNDYGVKIAAQDASPTDPYEPMSGWLKGMIWVGRTYRLTVPADMPPGQYALITGMYMLGADNTIAPLEHRLPDGQQVPFFTLGTVTVTG
jgi:4-amino-4-deoxy-L-arabinose transferase-like glycosyltransferase